MLNLPLFMASPVCASGANCRQCIDPQTGPAWRDEMRERFAQVPADGTCPRGVTYSRPGALATVTHGAVGVAKALLGIHVADDTTQARRLATCQGCEHVRLVLGIVNQCDKCGCIVRLKIKLANESCPIGKWGAAKPPKPPQ